MKNRLNRIVSCAISLVLGVSVVLIGAPGAVSAASIASTMPAFYLESNTFDKGAFESITPGTAIAATGYNAPEISPTGLASARFNSGAIALSAEANAAEGSLHVLANNKLYTGRIWRPTAAIVDTYTLTGLPGDLDPSQLQLSIAYGGTLSNCSAAMGIGVIGEKGSKSEVVKGPKILENAQMIVPLTQLVADPTQPFTLGIAAIARVEYQKSLADFENSLFIQFLANGVPVETNSLGGFHQPAAVPVPQSLVLFGSAIVGLITFRKKSKAY